MSLLWRSNSAPFRFQAFTIALRVLLPLFTVLCILFIFQVRELMNHERSPLPGLVIRRRTSLNTRFKEDEGQSPPDDFLPTRRVTDQLCYIRPDESELCEYDNVICWDGEGPVVVTPDPIRPEANEDADMFLGRIMDGQTKCMAYAALEPSAPEFTACTLGMPGSRLYSIPDDFTGDHALDLSVPVSRRRWGPLGRGDSLLFREVR